MKDKTATALLAFFLGGIGIHRFYLNQIGLGFLYLLFSWTFIPFIVDFIDFIVFLVMDKRNFDQKYNKENTTQNNNYFKTSTSEEIEKLYNLKMKGIITQEEFSRKKRDLL
jgi:TM2 domain-containing membrane protein YozV